MVAAERINRYSWVILGVTFVGQFSIALVTLLVAPLAPILQTELGLSKAEIGIFSAAVFAGSVPVLLIGGSLTDRFGVSRLLSLSLVATSVFMFSMSIAGSFVQAAAVMFAVGVTSGSGLPPLTKAIAEWFPPRARATAMGLKQAAVPVSGVVAASTVPALALALGWRSAIAVWGLWFLVGGILTAILYREVRPAGRRALAPGLREGLSEVVRNRDLWRLALLGALFVAVQIALITYLALFMAEIVLVPSLPDERTRILAAGGYLALCQVGGIFGRVFWGVVSDRVFRGRRMVVLAIVGSLTAPMLLVLAYSGSGSPLWLLTAVSFALGVTAIGWNGLFHVLIPETVGRRYAATGVGLAMTTNQVGTIGGPPLFGFVVDVTGSYRAGWLLLCCLAAFATMVAVLASKGEKHVA